jgi:hypothetical protein
MAGHEKLELYKEYPQPGEEEVARKLAEFLKWVILNREFMSGTTTRDVHVKSVAALKAELIVEPGLPPEMRHGVLREPRSWPCWVRYSNSHQRASKDINRDIRGMALKLMNVPGEKLLPQEKHATTQDFLCLSADVFLTRNSKEFLDFMVAFNTNLWTGFVYSITHPRIAIGFLQARKRFANLMEVQYFSGAQRLGKLAVRYSLKPRSDRKSEFPDNPGQNFLREVIDQQLAREEVYYDFMVQVQKDPYRQPIEDALVSWSQEISPYQKVATLRIPKQKVDTPERNWIGENLSMNPWHSLPEHQPLGNVNRARKIAYIEISKFRHGRNLVPMEEPVAGPDFLDT